MKKKIFLAIIVTFFLFVGCGQITSTNTAQQNGQSTITTSDTIDYNQYIKKVWIVINGNDSSPYGYPSFCISEIQNGKITGKFSKGMPAVPSNYYYSPDYFDDLTGTIDNDTAECQFSNKKGDKGNIKLVFKANDEIEAIIKYTDELQNSKYYREGTFQFKTYNINFYEKDSNIIKDKSFTVDLNSWSNVRFVSLQGTAKKHSTAFYLTDKDGDILYDFTLNINDVDVKEVSVQDVNQDGLKDIIIILNNSYGERDIRAAYVFFQKADGSFYSDSNVDKEINNSGNYKDVQTVMDYLSKK